VTCSPFIPRQSDVVTVALSFFFTTYTARIFLIPSAMYMTVIGKG
jgi:hypothetical protein